MRSKDGKQAHFNCLAVVYITEEKIVKKTLERYRHVIVKLHSLQCTQPMAQASSCLWMEM